MKNHLLSRRFKPAFAGLAFAAGMACAGVSAWADVTRPQIGKLLFEENFDQLNSTRWNTVEGNGCQYGPNLCGWGNQELQYYGANNVRVEEVPGESGNKALVLEAREAAVGGSAFTSGKLDSKDKIAVQYGMIEYRVRVPDVGTGLWPAVWMLGISTASWPLNGEIDMMEMGHRAQARSDAGFPGADINSFVGGNAIFYADGACASGNPSCAASTAWMADNAYLAPTPLTNRFVTYRTYWTDSQLRFTVFDNGVEHDMYSAPIDIGSEATELQAPFYLLLNLAVGGNFTDAATVNQVTAPLPAKMLVDYIRVYQLNGMGSVTLGDQTRPETGTFGVFTDNTSTSNKLEAGVSSDIYIWNTESVVAGDIEPREGANVIAWHYQNPNQWFGGGIPSRLKRDMSNFIEGNLKFKIKIPANVAFKVGIADTYTNENWVTFPANQTAYGLVRNGDWAEASIPVSVLRGSNIALQSLLSLFNIASVDGQLPTSSFQMAIDDILWEGGGASASSASQVPSSSVASLASSASSSAPANPLGAVQISALNAGGVKFSIRVPEQKAQVHLFTRRNGLQDYVVIDLHAQAGAQLNNSDGSYTYQISRPEAYAPGDQVEARFYTYSPASGQVFYPGPGENSWTSSTYHGVSSASSKPGLSSPASSSLALRSSSSSLADTTGLVQIAQQSGGGAKFSIRVAEQKAQVHLFTRRNGLQDYVVIDLHAEAGAQLNNGDGTYTYQASRAGSYGAGDLVEARFYTYTPASGQVFYPGPGDNTWSRVTYGGASSASSVATSLVPGSSAGVQSSSPASSGPSSRASSSVNFGSIVPLYTAATRLEPVIKYRDGNKLITRIADRGRDRHAKESHFQAYDHFLSFYWEHRSAAIEIVETQFADGTASVRMNVKTQFRLNDTEAENRWFYRGIGTVAEYCSNGTMNVIDDFNYYKEESFNCREGRAIRAGDKMEFELSQFLDHNVPNGRSAYYGTTYLYVVGEGLVPWDVESGSFTTAVFGGGTKDSFKIPEKAWLGGETSIHAATSGETDNHFMQMATNLAYDNGQAFLLGRRLHHTSFEDGVHDEKPLENAVFTEMVGQAGPRYMKESCADCHVRNGRAAPSAIGQPLEKWLFKVADAQGNPHPDLGRALQSKSLGQAPGEGQVSIAFWTEANGLRSPNYQFSGVTPEKFSARIAPQLVGIGLLEAIPESTILANAKPDASGISGRANRVLDPATGETRLGRFGWKAGTSSVKHQVANAFNIDMGVMTSLFPTPDCGARQTDCGSGKLPVADAHVNNLVKYISLLGVRPQRDYKDAAVIKGEALFANIGCAGCHTPTFQTSEFHPLAELRNQTIHPYTDLLLHDMGPGLADTLGDGEASGSEWRTAPLWGLGLAACVTGGVYNPGGQGSEVCTPEHSYLHDGRARSIQEAILWHGGEGEASRSAYNNLSSADKSAVLAFLNSL